MASVLEQGELSRIYIEELSGLKPPRRDTVAESMMRKRIKKEIANLPPGRVYDVPYDWSGVPEGADLKLAWDEADHPRGPDGKFGEGGNGGKTKTSDVKSSLNKVAGLKVTPSQLAKLAAINDSLDGDTIKVPLALKPDQVAAIQKAFPGKKIQKVNALKLMKGKEKSGETLSPKEKKMATKAPKPGKQSELFPKGSGPTSVLTDTLSSGTSGFPKGFKAKQAAYKTTMTYAEKNRIGHWKGSSTGIRNAEKNTVSPTEKEKARDWNDQLDKMPKFEGVVYRGLNQTKMFKDLPEVGGVVTMKTSSSSSRDPTKAAGFGTDRFLRILSKTGVNIEDVAGGFKGEKEVVLRKNSKYRVVAVHKNVMGKYGFNATSNVIDLEEI